MKITVRDVVGASRVLAGREGMTRRIRTPQVPRPELSQLRAYRDMAGSVIHLTPQQILHLCGLPGPQRARLCRDIIRKRPAAIVVSGGRICRELLTAAEGASITVFRSGSVARLTRLLNEHLLPRVGLHGVLVQIFGVGTLLLGESAIGKSEAALDLILRGHKLVADDVVMLERGDSVITGRPTEIGTDLLEIRGLGVINVKALYGDSATIDASDVSLVIELEEWRRGIHYSLLGLRERRYRLLGVNIPYLKLPVKPGRNMATLIEVAARNQTLKERGIYAARDLNRKLTKRLAQ
jgi:HPr kinase/phosphorylase